MAGQRSQFGNQQGLNNLVGDAIPVVGGSAPTPKPGLWWIDSGVVKRHNGTTWVADNGNRYLMLLVAEPEDGDELVNLAEVTTAGYSRQLVPWGTATNATPSVMATDALITFGPMSVDMALPAVAVALTDVSSGTTGKFLFWWSLPEEQQVDASQSIQVASGQLTISQS